MRLPTRDTLVSGGLALVVVLMLFLLYNQATVRESIPDDRGRQVLCIGILANVNNVARDNPTVVSTCRDAGVDRADYPKTQEVTQ